MKVTDYIAKYLDIIGVKCVFGYQGSSIAHLIDSISNNENIDFIEARHEQAAAFEANGYSMLNKELGVALACSGPGALNLITGIADAYYDSLPCLFFTGQVSQKEMRQNDSLRQFGFQETDIVSIVKPITKYAVSLTSPEQIIDELDKAISIALSGRFGPVLIDMPHNIQGSQIDVEEIKPRITTKVPDALDDADSICSCIKKANRPLLIIGGGMDSIDEATASKINALNIPVVTSYLGKTRLDNTLDCYCGTIGVYGERVANWAVKYSDAIICLGTRLDGRQTGGELLQQNIEQAVFVVDCDDAELDKLPNEYNKINADASKCLYDILNNVSAKDEWSKWLELVRKWRNRYPIQNEYSIADGVNPNLLLSKLGAMCPADTIFSTDVGQNQLWSNSSLQISQNQTLIQSGGLGSMGFSLPAAIGAYCASRRPVVCISGDGGFQMNMQELQLVSTHNIPINMFVLNNQCLGLIRDYQSKALGGRHYGSVIGFGSPSYADIAKAYGMKYICIKSDEDINSLPNVLNNNDAYIIEVLISGDSTGCPEPTYGSTIINQSKTITEKEREEIEVELNELG